VGKFVNQQIIDYRWRLKDGTDIETNYATAGAGAPARALPPHLHGVEAKVVTQGELGQTTGQRTLSMTTQPGTQ
jgi:hypothetical protein